MKLLPCLLASALFSPALASATLIFGLTATNGLISFDSATPGVVTSLGTISQVGIVDIDFYPANGVLYGSTASGNLYRISTTNAAASLAATPSMAIAAVTDIDFNPSADRLRVFGAGDMNYRMAPDFFTNNAGTPGTILVDGMWTNSAVDLVGSAYTNNFDGSAATQLFSIDSVSNQLFVHSNATGDAAGTFNQVTAVGALGIDAGSSVGFDIDQAGVAYLSNGNQLYSLNLATGSATGIGAVGGTGLVSIAAVAVPETSSAALLMLTGLAATAGRRRRR